MSDTSSRAAAIQASIHRQMSPLDRLQLAMEMSALAREFSCARIRDEHPDWCEPDVIAELIRRLYPGVTTR